MGDLTPYVDLLIDAPPLPRRGAETHAQQQMSKHTNRPHHTCSLTLHAPRLAKSGGLVYMKPLRTLSSSQLRHPNSLLFASASPLFPLLPPLPFIRTVHYLHLVCALYGRNTSFLSALSSPLCPLPSILSLTVYPPSTRVPNRRSPGL